MPYYGGRPWNYYGPSYSLSLFFGNTGWWHGDRFGVGFQYSGGARVFPPGHFNTVYRGGGFRGRDYVAPPERGGYYPRRVQRDDRNNRGDRSDHNDRGRR
jgi:hypothetical protein